MVTWELNFLGNRDGPPAVMATKDAGGAELLA